MHKPARDNAAARPALPTLGAAAVVVAGLAGAVLLATQPVRPAAVEAAPRPVVGPAGEVAAMPDLRRPLGGRAVEPEPVAYEEPAHEPEPEPEPLPEVLGTAGTNNTGRLGAKAMLRLPDGTVETVRVGDDVVGGLTVKTIEPNRVTFADPIGDAVAVSVQPDPDNTPRGYQPTADPTIPPSGSRGRPQPGPDYRRGGGYPTEPRSGRGVPPRIPTPPRFDEPGVVVPYE